MSPLNNARLYAEFLGVYCPGSELVIYSLVVVINTNLAGYISLLSLLCLGQICTERWNSVTSVLFIPVVVTNKKLLFRAKGVFDICERVSAFHPTPRAVLSLEKRPRGERPDTRRGRASLSGAAGGAIAARAGEDVDSASGSFPPHSHNFSRSLEAGWISCLLRHTEEEQFGPNGWKWMTIFGENRIRCYFTLRLPH